MSKQNVQQLSKQAKDAEKKIANLTQQYAKLELLGTIYNTICLEKKAATSEHERITIKYKASTMNMKVRANMAPGVIETAIRSRFQIGASDRLLLLDADHDIIPIDATLTTGEYVLETPSVQKKQVAQGFVGEVHKGAECKESSKEIQDKIKDQHLYEGERLTADFTDEKWIARHRYMYDKLDKDGNGFVTLDEFVYKASVEICGGLGATKAQTKRHTQAVVNFFSGAGMKFGVEQHWADYIKGWEKLVNEELDRWANKEPTLIREWGEALFDIIDTSGNGAIDLEEWKKYQEIAQVVGHIDDSKAIFDICDINKDGKIEIDEMCRQHVGFWYTADPASDGLYGPLCP